MRTQVVAAVGEAMILPSIYRELNINDLPGSALLTLKLAALQTERTCIVLMDATRLADWV